MNRDKMLKVLNTTVVQYKELAENSLFKYGNQSSHEWEMIDNLEVISDFVNQLPDRYFELTVFPGGTKRWK